MTSHSGKIERHSLARQQISAALAECMATIRHDGEHRQQPAPRRPAIAPSFTASAR